MPDCAMGTQHRNVLQKVRKVQVRGRVEGSE